MVDPSNFSTWLNAYGATLIISLIPNLILFLIPSKVLTEDKKSKFNFQNISLSFAAGGLLGDVFLHIIPDLFMKDGGHHDHHGHDHGHEHGHDHHNESCASGGHDHCHTSSWFQSLLKEHHSLYIGLLVLAGFLVFIAIEKFITLNSTHDHSHDSHSDEKTAAPAVEKSPRKTPAKATRRKSKSSAAATPSAATIQSEPTPSGSSSSWFPASVSSSVLINLLADSMHNLTDGLALGASYARGQHGLVLATLLSVLFHEIPHEVGDMAVLMKNGYTKWQAIRVQFVTAVAAFIGTSLGLFFQENEVVSEILLGLTCGGFVFVAAVNIIPPVLQDKHAGLSQVLLELLAFLGGVGLMVGVVFLEEGDGHKH